MLNITKHYEFFDPAQSPPVHIIGCGALGSHIGEQLARLGVSEITLWDFDVVEPVNVANQAFHDDHINLQKTTALKKLIKSININAVVHEQGRYSDEHLDGIVFIMADNIDVRRKIVKTNRYTSRVTCFIDARMNLTDAQMYSAYFDSQTSIDNLLKTMDFTQEEAQAAAPVSACGTTLSVIPTVAAISSYCISTYITAVLDGKPKYRTVFTDMFHGIADIYLHE